MTRGTTLLFAVIKLPAYFSTIMLHSFFSAEFPSKPTNSVWLLRGEFICIGLMLPCTTRQLSRKALCGTTTPHPTFAYFIAIILSVANKFVNAIFMNFYFFNQAKRKVSEVLGAIVFTRRSRAAAISERRLLSERSCGITVLPL